MRDRNRFIAREGIVVASLTAILTLATACGDDDSDGGAGGTSAGDGGSAGSAGTNAGSSGTAGGAEPGAGSGGGGTGGAGGEAGASGSAGSGTGGAGEGGASGEGGSSGTGGAGGSGGSTGSVPDEICARLIDQVDTSSPDHVVGDGSSASCTFTALEAAVVQGGAIAFNCGPDPVTIDVTAALQLPLDRDTTVDGGGLITLDGGRLDGRTNRIFEFDSPDFRATDTVVVLQGLTLQNAEAPAVDYTPEDAGNPACAYGYADGAGGAVYVRDGRLRVLDCTFSGNRAATPGPDVGGGAIYALGANEVTVVGSRFLDNQGSNSGAVGLLHAEGSFVNCLFENNQATGTGANYAGGDADGCPGVGHANQGGAGGNGTVIAIDGGADDHNSFCGCIFRGNQGNELGTVFRTPNSARSRLSFDRCAFIDNYAGSGGGAMYVQDVDLEIQSCTFSGNHSDGLGGAVRVEQGAHGSEMLIENSTFYGNYTDGGLGGALVYSCGDWTPTPPCGEGVVRNVTFASNEARGGEGFFAAAILNHGSRRTLSVFNSIFLDNTDNHEWTPMTCSIDNPGAPATMPGSGNLQWPAKRVGGNDQDDNPCTAGITWQNALLGALADNGGPTATLMPEGTSPALGAGSDCPATDQRGQPRPAQGCTAGAVEP